MERWQQDFDFYLAQLDDQPASFVFDLNAAAHAPVASHPLAVRITVPMLRPRPDGLRDASELDELAALEDQFVDALEAKVDAIYVGRVVHAGATTLYLYVPESHRAAVEELPLLTGAPPGDYAPSWTLDAEAASAFLAEVEGASDEDAQERMARVTGNYRRGNERTAKRHPRNS